MEDFYNTLNALEKKYLYRVHKYIKYIVHAMGYGTQDVIMPLTDDIVDNAVHVEIGGLQYDIQLVFKHDSEPANITEAQKEVIADLSAKLGVMVEQLYVKCCLVFLKDTFYLNTSMVSYDAVNNKFILSYKSANLLRLENIQMTLSDMLARRTSTQDDVLEKKILTLNEMLDIMTKNLNYADEMEKQNIVTEKLQMIPQLCFNLQLSRG